MAFGFMLSSLVRAFLRHLYCNRHTAGLPAGYMAGMNHPFIWNWQAWLNAVFIPLSLLYFFWGSRAMK
jgi:hypothetical protein